MNEKRKLLIHRLIWLTIVLLIILIPIIANACQPTLEIVDTNCYITNYYSSLNETSVEVDITFNRNVDSGYATVKFYDSSNYLLETKKIYFYGYHDKTVENSYTTVKGKVDKYEIISYEFEPTNDTAYIYIFLLPAIIMLIGALLLSYKEYDYSGKKISVYAGWCHHTLRVNGEIYDEHTTLISWTPICLSTTLDDGTKLEATITLTNRISLKANDKLIAPSEAGNKLTNPPLS
ncbi:MAG: hypothetical protein IK147_00685 [Clostridia bacterium]|nr:hypothetical protein [Clostridia bacterium]